jgi:hypothetical protein
MYNNGLHYGYPKCCINDQILRLHNEQEVDPIQEYAGRYSGFIPCMICCKKIILNRLNIEDLIKNRKCKTQFPHDGEKGGISVCKKHARLIFLQKITISQVLKSNCKDCYFSDDDKNEYNEYNEYNE